MKLPSFQSAATRSPSISVRFGRFRSVDVERLDFVAGRRRGVEQRGIEFLVELEVRHRDFRFRGAAPDHLDQHRQPGGRIAPQGQRLRGVGIAETDRAAAVDFLFAQWLELVLLRVSALREQIPHLLEHVVDLWFAGLGGPFFMFITSGRFLLGTKHHHLPAFDVDELTSPFRPFISLRILPGAR